MNKPLQVNLLQRIQLKDIELRFWNFCLFLFCLSLFVSKSGLTLTTFLLILTAFVSSWQREAWLKEKKIILIISLFPLALIVNLFSLGGTQSVFKVATSWPWILLAAPAYCAYLDKRSHRWIVNGLVMGLVLSLLNTFHKLYIYLTSENTAPFMSDQFRLASFWDVSRWGYFLGLVIIALFLQLQEKLEIKLKLWLLFLLGLSGVSLVLTNSRAPVLALFVLFGLLAVTQRKLFKNILFVFLIGSSFLFFNPQIQKRIQSIFAVQVINGEISSTHASNSARFTMWKIAFDFFRVNPWFGTGFESTEKPLKEFIESQGPQYLEKFNMAEFSYNDQHSSYINILVQMGGIYFLVFFSALFGLIFIALKSFISNPDPFSRLLLANLVYCLVIFIFYSALSSYESVVFFISLALLIAIDTQYRNLSEVL